MKCLNCHSEINEQDKFCPHCGQQVDGNNLKLKALFKEFFENYLSLDTRIGRSIIPFFFKPGRLTKEFNEGKRKNYANPFRLYIFCSLIFFSAISINIGKVKDIIQITPTSLNKNIQIDKEDRDSINKYLKGNIISKLNIHDSLPFHSAFAQLNREEQLEVLDLLKDTSGMNLILDSINTVREVKSEEDSISAAPSLLGKIDWLYLQKVRYDRSLTDSAVYRHMKLKDESYLASRTYFQIIKIYRSDQKTFAKFIFKNFSFAMFFIVPISALILMLLFGRQRFYVEYLIYSIHIHSLLFFMGGLVSFVNYIFDFSTSTKVLLTLFSMAYAFVYFIIGLFKLYQKGFFRTILRLIAGLFLYYLCLVVISALEFYTSFLLY